jgi:hypothetical protein
LISYLVGVEEIQAVASPTDNLLGLRLGRLQDYFPDAAHVFPPAYGFGARELTIFSKRGSPRSGSQKGGNFSAAMRWRALVFVLRALAAPGASSTSPTGHDDRKANDERSPLMESFAAGGS